MKAENTKKYVIDASFVLAFMLPDESNAEVTETFIKYQREEISFISSVLLPFEVLNALKMSLNRKRIDEKLMSKLAEDFLDYSIHLNKVNYLEVLNIAVKYNISFYDGSYLCLSKSLGLELLTLDRPLLALARKK